MANGRINSRGSMKTASRVISAFGGSWQAVEQAARVDRNGVHVIARSMVDRSDHDRHDAKK